MADIFKAAQPAEYLRTFLREGIRPDGRTLTERRDVLVNKGSIGTAQGSAVVRLGDSTVVCGIKAEIAVPRVETPKEGYIVPNVELGPLCSSRFKPGPPSSLAQCLSQLMHDIIIDSRCLNLEDLCIAEGKHVWVLYVDMLCINYGGNMPDVCSAAMLAALTDVRLPRTTVSEESGEPVLDGSTPWRLELACHPLTTTLVIFDGCALLDPTEEEEDVSAATVTVMSDGERCSLLKTGGEMGAEDMSRCLELAIERAKSLRKAILAPASSRSKTE